MDKETKVLFTTLGLAFVVLLILKPKGFKLFNKENSIENKYSAPKESNPQNLKNKENAVIAMQAMKDAMLAKESKSELVKLSDMILKQYGIKITVSTKTRKLRANLAKDGSLIAEEA